MREAIPLIFSQILRQPEYAQAFTLSKSPLICNGTQCVSDYKRQKSVSWGSSTPLSFLRITACLWGSHPSSPDAHHLVVVDGWRLKWLVQLLITESKPNGNRNSYLWPVFGHLDEDWVDCFLRSNRWLILCRCPKMCNNRAAYNFAIPAAHACRPPGTTGGHLGDCIKILNSEEILQVREDAPSLQD